MIYVASLLLKMLEINYPTETNTLILWVLFVAILGFNLYTAHSTAVNYLEHPNK